MKNILSITTWALLVITMFNACEQQYIDPITSVDPGADESAPEVVVNFPPNGYELQTNAEIASINIRFEVRDDIEIDNISVSLNGTEIASYNDFIDYRVAKMNFDYDNVTTGDHVLIVAATDLDGKTTEVNVNFSKSPPYVAAYDGEVFYMPFNGEYREMNSLDLATAKGTPGFAGSGNGIQHGNAYAGAADAYLTFPSAGLQGTNAVSATFWMKVDDTMDRAGILVAAPPADNNNDRTKGFRFFREASNGGATQRFKLNVGNGTADSWFDGGASADVIPNTGEWTHFAFTITDAKVVVYINGEIVSEGSFTGLDWTDCEILSIMSGEPNWTGWGHYSDGSLMDELRIYNVELSQEDIQTIMLKEQASFYVDFNGDYMDAVSGEDATVVGSPDFEFSGGVFGDAYKGATDSYLTFDTEGILGDEFSASFWLNVNNSPDRAGILVVGPEDTDNPDAQNDRTSGFRFFREASNAGATQRFKLNAGNGTADSWFDGGASADVDPTTGDWVHFAFSISGTEAVVYIDGVQVSQGVFTGIDWTGCDVLSIMSGAPRFTGWGHLSDQSLMDELRLFSKAITADEVNLLYNDGL